MREMRRGLGKVVVLLVGKGGGRRCGCLGEGWGDGVDLFVELVMLQYWGGLHALQRLGFYYHGILCIGWHV